MRLPFLVCLIILLFSNISCDDDGKKINGDILLSIRDETTFFTNVYRMTEDGELTKLGPFDDYSSGGARWSPDGKKIAFSTAKRSTTLGASLYIMNSDGSHARPIKELDMGGGESIPLFGAFPSWSPDGKKIVYSQCACEAGGNSEIFVIDLETKQETQLTNDDFSDGIPLWYPDGTKILFTSAARDSNKGFEIYSMDPEGTNQTQITFNRGRAAAWSNNDSILAYFATNDTSIHIMNIRTTEDVDKIPINLIGEILNPTMAWSPDNSSIIFLAISNQGYPFQHLYKLDLSNHSITRLLDTYSYVTFVDWLKR